MQLDTSYENYKFNEYFNTDLPSHWMEKRLGYLAKEDRAAFVDGPFGSDLKSSDYKDSGVPLIQLNNIRDSKHLMQNIKFVTDGKKKQLIRHLAIPGDIVIAKMADPVARAAIVVDNYPEYVIVADCVKLTPNENLVDLKFLVWAINCDYVRINAELVSTGTTRVRVNLGELKKLKIPYPPNDEQQKIANFLDHETAKIDTLIEKQQQLIALLKEKRQAVISHAVTKGLNPNAPMKNSGVEWLGDVPEHWEVCRVKQITNFITSGPRGWSDYLSENGDDIFLQSGDLNNKLGLELSAAKKISPPSNAEGVRTKLKNGDVVVCITGANTGRVAITPNLNGTIYINQHLSLIRPIKRLIDTDYLGLVLSSSSVKSYFSVTQYGLKEGLSLSNVGEAPTCRPPLKEQKEIVKHVWNESDRYDALESYAGKQVALLRERRTALISAAVTGKIDVRNWVLPEEVENMDVALSSGLR